MRFVESAPIYPSRCAVLPQIGANHPKGYIDTQSEIVSSGKDSHVYVSVVAVEEMARKLKWHSPETVDELERTLESYKHRVAQLEDEVDGLNKDFDAIEQLQSRGYQARKKPGRKPTSALREA
jgi:RIO-like serine/threonine protein kinase